MPSPRQRTRRRDIKPFKPARIRTLQLLDGCGVEGCTEAILHAHGFATADIVELMKAKLATAHTGTVIAGSRRMEVVHVRITDKGRKALERARR